tara:strand:+ start:71 stop:838 length:768 start_codon:yes stop_codon:yes gene_type:complete
MAEITFHANISQGVSSTPSDPTAIDHSAGSGLGFFGDGFNLSVPVSQYQNTTWVTNSDGTSSDGTKLQNTKYASATGVTHNSEDLAYELDAIPNYWAPLNIRFTHTEAVATQNCKLRIFDRNDIDVHATEVTTKVYEVRHPHPTVGNAAASNYSLKHRASNASIDDDAWFTFDGVGDVPDMNLTSSPGISGLNGDSDDLAYDPDGIGANDLLNWKTSEGFTHKSTRHDWYLALTASPQSIGSKTDFGLYFTLEYL